MHQIKLKKQKKSYDNILLGLLIIFTFLGVALILDASAPEAINTFSNRFYFAKQQFIWGILGIALMFIVSRINYSFWQKLAVPLLIFAYLFLFLVLMPKIGIEALGAKRRILIGPISLQPSEFVKLAIAIYMAKVASSGKKILSYLVPLFIALLFIILQPDLGTAIIILLIVFSQIFIAGIDIFKIVVVTLCGLIGVVILAVSSQYRRERLMTFLNPLNNALDSSYHIKQILYALGSGGIFGVGLGQSRQKFLFLPEAASDSIFAVISEELGFVGATAFIFLYVFLFSRCLKIAKNAPDKYSKVLASGITAWLAGQTLINLSSMVSLTPLTGVPLPFISYGGSSLISILVGCGILLNISRYAKEGK